MSSPVVPDAVRSLRILVRSAISLAAAGLVAMLALATTASATSHTTSRTARLKTSSRATSVRSQRTTSRHARSSGGATFKDTSQSWGSAGACKAGASDSRHLGNRVLHIGMRGHDVRVLQDYLSIAGYWTDIDGDFGPGTRRSVIAFQRAHGFAANGVVTCGVQRALRRIVARVSARSVTGRTRINGDGTATAPAGAPGIARAVIAAANRIHTRPYIYGGGHGTWNDSGYDCSGAVSYALHGGGLLSSPEDSTELESWGSPGRGRWITVYANSNHTWMVVAGRAFDTSNFGGPNIPDGSGPRWRWNPTGNFGDGESFVVRHPAGL